MHTYSYLMHKQVKDSVGAPAPSMSEVPANFPGPSRSALGTGEAQRLAALSPLGPVEHLRLAWGHHPSSDVPVPSSPTHRLLGWRALYLFFFHSVLCPGLTRASPGQGCLVSVPVQVEVCACVCGSLEVSAG